MKTAKRQMSNPHHKLESFWWTGKCPYQMRDQVILILKEDTSRRMVSPPGVVVNRKEWRDGTKKCTFVYIEHPAQNRMTVERLAKKIGKGAQKRLQRGGLVNRDFAERLLSAWNK